MTVQPQFTQAQPVNLKKPPIVLRFSGLWPHTLRRFRFQDERRGGDLGHVDLGRTKANEILVGGENWDQVIRDEIVQMADLRRRECGLVAEVQSLEQHRAQEAAACITAQSARQVEEQKLEDAVTQVQLKVAEAEIISEAVEAGLELVAEGALLWQEEATDRKAGLVWGAAAPKTGDLRAEKRKQIHPAIGMITRIAQLVARTVKRALAKERQKLQDDTEYVRGLREQWEPEAQARLAQISQGTDAGPS